MLQGTPTVNLEFLSGPHCARSYIPQLTHSAAHQALLLAIPLPLPVTPTSSSGAHLHLSPPQASTGLPMWSSFLHPPTTTPRRKKVLMLEAHHEDLFTCTHWARRGGQLVKPTSQLRFAGAQCTQMRTPGTPRANESQPAQRKVQGLPQSILSQAPAPSRFAPGHWGKRSRHGADDPH